MNSVNITGRFVADPEVKTTQNGTAVCSFTVAVDKRYKPKELGEPAADFIDCVAWRHTAEFIGKYFSKGRMVAISGSLQPRTYKDKNGMSHKVTEVVADEVGFCDRKPDNRADDWPEVDDGGELPF